MITVVVNDGETDSNIATATLFIDSVDDVPVIDLDANDDSGASGSDYNTSFTEGGGAVSVADTDISISDVDSTTLSFARIELTNRPDGADESLSVNGALPTGISLVAYNPGTGVLFLTGSASLADYETAIQQVEYNNTSANPDTANRIIEITVNDGGDLSSDVATTTIVFSSSNDAPVLDLDADDDSGATGANFLGSFTEDLGPVAIGDIVDPDITITDADNANLVSATITLTNRPDGDAIESLSINGSLPSGITTTGYNIATGELVLTGTASLADYQTAIGQIRYNNTSQDPNPADRTIEVVVNDGIDDSNTATATISVNPVIDAPVISDLDGDSLAYTEGDGVVVLDQSAQLTVADADSPNFDTGQLVVSITAGGVNLEDVLAIEDQGTGAGQVNTLGLAVRIGTTQVGSFVGGANGADLQITFNSTATAADVEAVTRAITYENTDTDNPTEGNRDIQFLLSDGDGGTSTPSVVTVTVARENDAPTIQFLTQTRAYNEGQGALVIDNLTPAQISDVDSTDFNGGNLTVSITAGGDAAEDVLSIQSQTPATDAGNISISGSNIVVGNGTTTDVFATFTGGTGGADLVITFNSALATPALVSDLAALLTYENTDVDNPTSGNRTIEVTVNDGDGGTSAAAVSTVNVLISNDPPVVNDLAGDTLAYSEGDLFQIIDQGTLATVVDPDSANFDNGVLTVSITNRVVTEDIISLSDSGTGITLSAGVGLNSDITIDGDVIGTIASGGALNQNLVVTFNEFADNTDVQTVINAVTYLNNNNINPDETQRTVRFFLTDGDGGSTGNVDTFVNVTGVDDLTSLSGVDDIPLNYNEGDGAQIIDQGTPITISDGDSPDFDGGFLRIQVVSGGDTDEDLLGIQAVGTNPGEIDVSGSTVTFGGVTIGTIVAGPNNVSLQVDLNANATPEAVQALARQFTYTNTDTDDPTTSTRTIRFFVDDGDGGTATSSDATVTVNPVNDAPSLTATGDDPGLTEGAGAQGVFSVTSIDTVEAGQTIIGLTFTVTNVDGTTDEVLAIDGSNITLDNGNSGTTATNNITFNVTVSGSTATVVLSSATLTTGAAEALVDAVTYANTSDDPTATAATRVVSITEIVDSGGTANGGVHASNPAITSTVTITPINDPPTLTATGDDPTFTEGGSAQGLFSSAAASTIESGQTITSLELTVTNVDGTADEVLAIDGTTIALTDTNSGTTATNGLNFAVTVSGSTATVTLTGGTLSELQTQTLVNGITYSNASDDPTAAAGDRVVTITEIVDSGPGGIPHTNTTTLAIASTVTVTPVNDAPSLTATGTDPNWVETSPAPLLFSGTSIDTVEAGQDIIGFTFTITNVQDGNDDILFVGGNNVFLNDGNTIGVGSGFTANVSFSGTTATVTLTGGTLTVAAAETFIDDMRWQNSGDDPGAAGNSRDITITEIVDSGGTANGGVNTSNPGITSTVAVTPVNDPTTADLPRAASFGGTTGDFSVDNTLSGLAGSLPTGHYTVSFWVNDPTTEGANETYISYAVSGQNNELVLSKSGGNLHILTNGGAEPGVDTGLTIPTDGNWHHIAVTVNVTTGAFEVFLDGESAGTGTTTPGGIDLDGTLVLGQEQDALGGGFTAAQALDGSLADVAIFSGELSQGAIDTISNGTVTPTNAILFLRWNDDTLNFEDISGGGNDQATNGTVTTDTGPVATVTEDGSIVISGIEVVEPDNATTTVTISVANGEIAFTGATTGLAFSDGDGSDGTLTFTGTPAEINAALANSIEYSPDLNFDGTDTLTVTADDGSGAGPALNLTIPIIPVNDDPVAAPDFAEVTAVSLPSRSDDIDAILANDSGATGSPNATQLLDNDGSGALAASNAGTPDIRGTDVALGDIDGDGDLDAIIAVTANLTGNQLLTNQGGLQGGTEGTFVATTLPGGSLNSFGVTFGDIDNDGDLDAFIANWVGSGSQLLTNQGGLQAGTEGTFVVSTLPGSTTGGATSFRQGRDFAVADVDGDGDLDAVVANDGSANQLYLNQGGLQAGTIGTFAATDLPFTVAVGTSISVSVTFGDVDGDGNIDVVVGNTGGENEVLINDGSGSFTSSVLAGGSFASTEIALGDLDGDGDLDAIVTNGTATAQNNQVLINQGGNQAGTEGVFVASDITGSVGKSSDVALADIDGDGDLDAIITNTAFDNAEDQTNQLLINDGTGSFTVSVLDGGNSATNAVAFGDLDGDGVVAAVGADGLPNVNLSPVRGSVATNDFDPDSPSLTYTLDAPVNGLTLNADGSWVFDPTHPSYASLGEGQTTVVVANYTVDDGVGTPDQSTLTITVTGTNDAPVLDLDLNDSSGATGGDFNSVFSVGGGPAALGDSFQSDLDISDIDDTNIESAVLTLTNRPDGADEFLVVTVAMPAGITASAYNPADGTITLTGSASISDYEAALERIRYDNNSANPSLDDRIITITVNDGNDDSNVATATVSMNDNPVIANLSNAYHIFNEGDAPLLLDVNAAATVTDTQSADFDGGQLTVTILPDGEAVTEDLLSVDTSLGTVALSGTTATSDVSVGGTVIGTLVNDIDEGNDFVVDLNANATPALIQTLIQSLTYQNTEGSNLTAGTRTIHVTLTDGDGGTTSFSDVEFTEQTGPINNPLDAISAGTHAAPTFVDIDGDGNLDMFLGRGDGNIDFYRNTGTPASATFTQQTGVDNPFDGITFGIESVIDFADLDNDGDLDALVGDLTGSYRGFLNTGTAAVPNFVEVTGDDNPFDAFGVDDRSSPTFVDIDNDGDLDMFSGDDGGSISYFENTGSEDEPEYTERTGVANPLNAVGVNRDSVLTFADLDNDGDLDVVIGERGGAGGGPLHVWENTGSVTGPTFSEVTGAASPLDGILIDNGRPAFVDIDDDGDLDLIVGNDAGQIQFFENTANSSSASVTVTVNGVNDDPFASLDEFTAKKGDTIIGNLVTDDNGHGPDFDPDGNPISIFIPGRYNSENGGSVLINADGSFIYEAPTGFVGLDTFIYAIEDGLEGFDVGYAAIQISKNSTAPIVRNGAGADDLLRGSSGSDTLSGFAGDDILRAVTAEQSAAAAGDVLDGGADDDTLWTQGGRSTLIGGTGNDNFVSRDEGLFYDLATVDYSSSTGSVFVNLTSTANSGVEAGQADDGLTGTDFLNGVHAFSDGQGSDTFLADGSFTNSHDGGLQFNLGRGGNDTVDFSGSSNAVRRVSFQNLTGPNGVAANLAAGTATVNAITIATLFNVNQLFGSAQDDTLTGDGGDNVLRGSDGTDSLVGGGGNDTADFRDGTNAARVDLTLGSNQVGDDGFGNIETLNGIDNLFGSAFDDSFAGDGANNTFVGFAGNDTLFGGGGEDILRGDFDDPDFLDGGFGGDDFLDGGSENDQLFGGAGDDILFGGAGNDMLFGGSGNDQLFGGPGNDILHSGGAPNNIPSNFTLQDELFGGEGDDQLFGEGGAVLLTGGAGADTITVNDTGSFFDWAQLNYRTSTDSVIGNFTSSILDTSLLTNVSLSENINLNPNEVLDGIQVGGTGDGSIDTATGMHVIIDGLGNDYFAYDGSNTNSFGNFIEIRLGWGDDFVDFTGAAGTRRLSYRTADGGVEIDMTAIATPGAGQATDFGISNAIGTDMFVGVSALRGSQFADNIIGDTQTTRYRPQAGDDMVTGNAVVASQNTVEYVASEAGAVVDLSIGLATDDGYGYTDTLVNIRNVSGSSFGDTITGDANDNELFGRAGDDLIFGGDGRDTIIGDFGDEVDPVTGAVALLGGDDDLFGGASHDFINGRSGNDLLVGGSGFDTLFGGEDTEHGIRQYGDVIDYSQETGGGAVNVDFSNNSATDTFGDFDFIREVERVIGTSNGDTLTGGNTENDDFEQFHGGGGNDVIDGGSGFDEASYRFAAAGIIVDMDDAVEVNDDGDGGTAEDLISIEAIEGSEFDDDISAAPVATAGGLFRVTGRQGNDTITGNSIDTQASYWNAGADPANNDVGATVNLSGLSIVSLVTGNNVAAGRAEDGLEITPGVFGIDILSGISSVRGSRFDDHLVGGGVDETFIGGTGDDTIDGGGGANTVDYGAERALTSHLAGAANRGVNVDLTTNTAIDGFGDTDTLSNIQNIIGTEFADRIVGDAAANVITGGGTQQRFDADSDVLIGGAGDDTLSASGGAVIFRGDQGNDIITSTDTAGDFDFAQAEYITSPSAINVSNSGSDLSISDGFGTTDTVSGVHVIRDSRHGDTFNVDLGAYANSFGTFLEIRLSEGNDNVTFTNTAGGVARVSYATARGGVNATFTGATDAVAGANFIGTDTFSGVNYLRGSSFDDILTGDGNNNIFRGSDGADSIDGGLGTDRIDHGDSPDAITVNLSLNLVIDDGYGNTDTLTSIENVRGGFFDDNIIGDGAQNDLRGGNGNDTILGGGDNDSLRGQSGNDILDGEAGNDTLRGGDGDDLLTGGEGDDNVLGEAGNDTIIAGSGLGNDTYDGGSDNDTITYASTTGGVNVDLAAGTATDKTIAEINTDTIIVGTIENVIGGTGDDDITGDGNDNLLSGGDGNDVISGGDGDDILEGGEGNDTINTGDNNFNGDTVIAGIGTDTIDFNTAQGFYILDYSGLANAIAVDLDAGSVNKGASGTDTILNISSIDNINGGLEVIGTSGDDNFVNLSDPNGFVQFKGGAGNDTIDGGTGFLRADYANAAKGVIVDQSVGQALQDGFDGVDTFIGGITEVRGSDFADFLTGDAGNNRFIGRGGDDIIDGGDGFDLMRYDRFNNGGVDVDLQTGVAYDGLGDVDTLISIEHIFGSRNDDDFIKGSAANEEFDGRGGNDQLDGRGGNDLLFGNSGDDTLDGGTGNDLLDGGNDNDTLTGGTGNDELDGGSGADELIGGDGFDTLFGGGDTDIFTFLTATGADIDYIIDFAVGSEVLDFSAILSGNSGSDFVEAVEFAENVIISIDVDGTGVGFDFEDVVILRDVGIAPNIDYRFAAGSTATVGATTAAATALGTAAGESLGTAGPGPDQFISGLGGFDTLTGGDGDDWLDGGADGDTIIAGLGSDIIFGGGDFDATGEFDILSYATHTGGPITVDMTAGTVTDGTTDIDIFQEIEEILGTSGADTFFGGFDFIQYAGLGGNDTIDNSQADDRAGVDYSRDEANGGLVGAGVTVDLAAGTATDGFGDTDTLIDVNFVNGTNNVDDITGGSGDDFLIGLDGADIIRGGDGNDEIFGAASFATDTAANELFGEGGDDNLFGSDGDDILQGGFGADTIETGGGLDELVYEAAEVGSGVDTITDFDILSDTLDLSGLLDANFNPGNQSTYIQATFDAGSGHTTISVDADGAANGTNFTDIAVLESIGGAGTSIDFIDDDSLTQTVVSS